MVKFSELVGQAQCLYRYRGFGDNNIDALQKIDYTFQIRANSMILMTI